MSKIIETIKVAFSIFFLIISLVLMFWYINSFYRFTSDIDLIVSNTKVELTGDLNQLHSIAISVESKQGIKNWAARQAYYQLSYKSRIGKKSHTVFSLNSILWNIALQAYLTEDELFLLWCHFAIYQGDWGVNHAAIKFFGKPILELPVEKQISIISMVKAPSKYRIGSKALEKRVHKMLLKYEQS